MSHIDFEDSILINPTDFVEDSVDLNTNPSDLYAFNLQENRFVNIALFNLSSDADLYLYDSNQNPIFSSNYENNTSEFIYGEFSVGTYFIEVRAWSGSTNYLLDINSSLLNDVDDNGSFATAISIDLGSNFNYDNISSINSNSDVRDFYTFQLNTNSSVEITLSDLSADIDLFLYSSNRLRISSSDVSGSDNEFISQELTPGQYFVEVYSYSGETSYSLNVISSDSNNSEPLKLEAGTAQIAYVAYYGRPADPGGVNFWNDTFQRENINYSPQGDRGKDDLTGQERDVYDKIADDFGNSDEAIRLFGSLNNSEKVNQVYKFVFNRDAEAGGLNYWTDQLSQGNVTLATFALEVALGAQNNDLTVLQNKIDSANLFSQGVETHPNGSLYAGSTGEIFGRNWLSSYENTVATIDDVNNALNNLNN